MAYCSKIINFKRKCVVLSACNKVTSEGFIKLLSTFVFIGWVLLNYIMAVPLSCKLEAKSKAAI